MKKLLLAFLILNLSLLIGEAQAQNQFSGNVRITTAHPVYRIDEVTIKGKATKGDNITRTWQTKENGKTVEVTQESTVNDSNTDLPTYTTTKKVKMKGLAGNASLYVDEDSLKVNINYWLNPLKTVAKKDSIVDRRFFWQNMQDTIMVDTIFQCKQLKDDKESFYLFRIDAETRAKFNSIRNKSPWGKFTKRVIEVFEDTLKGKQEKPKFDTIPSYYLIDKYSRESEYVLDMPNRLVFRFRSSNWELGAITIPLKIHFSHKKNGKTVGQEVVADYNIGVFGGWSYGREKYRYESKGGLKRMLNTKGTIGGTIGIAHQELDSLSTTAAEHPLTGDSKLTIAVMSAGLGLMFSINDIKLACFAGLDVGIGSASGKWNHHARPYLGIGLGYNLAGLLGKKE